MSDLKTANVKTVLILGATGGFGRPLSLHMARRGWMVRAQSRGLRKVQRASTTNDVEVAMALHLEQKNIQWVEGNLDEPSSLRSAAEGVDLIVHAVNAPYPKWDPLMINYTRAIVELARESNAHLMFVGNVYNAGIPTSGVITEHTEHAPVNEKGQIRATLEDMLEDASESGVRSTIMRFGDFFGPNIATSNWFNICTKGVLKNKLATAGPADITHTWAYLPDAVKAMEQVASVRIASPEQPYHMVLPFTGHAFSFTQLRSIIEARTGTTMKISGQPWWLFKVLGFIVPLLRDLASMRYLWNHDIQMDGGALETLLGSKPEHTPLAQAVYATVPGLGIDKDHDVHKNITENSVYS